jgi:hypothetical protein
VHRFQKESATLTWFDTEFCVLDGVIKVKKQTASVAKITIEKLDQESLITPWCNFMPTPMYILDEIDAAVGLSHTQSIGTLFRTRFRGAHFIVISPKVSAHERGRAFPHAIPRWH